jgi:hypothetical protein
MTLPSPLREKELKMAYLKRNGLKPYTASFVPLLK